MKNLVKTVVLYACILLMSGVSYAAENAISDSYGEASMLGDYGSETKRVRLNSSGAIIVDANGGSSMVSRKETSQNLASGALSYTTNFSNPTKILYVLVHSSAAISQTVTVRFNSKTSANYDTLLLSETLVSNTDVVYIPIDLILQDDDEIDVTCTNTGTPAATAYVTVVGQTIG